MPAMPADKWPDSNLAVLAGPYRFISERERLRTGDDGYAERFAHEVRRFARFSRPSSRASGITSSGRAIASPRGDASRSTSRA